MLQDLGLVVDLVPRVVEVLHEERLDEPVPSHDPQREGLAGRRQRHGSVPLVLDEPVVAEPADEAGCPRRRGTQLPRDLSDRSSHSVDDFDAVLDDNLVPAVGHPRHRTDCPARASI